MVHQLEDIEPGLHTVVDREIENLLYQGFTLSILENILCSYELDMS